MKGEKITKALEFQSLEEEKEYWETRGPLADGHKGRLSKPVAGQKRSSVLAVRLTGEELTKLRDVAAKRGLGPSTFARIVLTSVTEHEGELPQVITVDELKTAFANSMTQAVKDKAEIFAKKVAIGDPDDPSLLLIDGGQMKDTEELGMDFLRVLLSMVGVQLVTPGEAKYEDMKKLIKR